MKRTFKLDIPEVEQIPEFVKILDDLQVGNNVFLVGAAGTGKTTLGEKVAYSYMGRRENDGEQPPFIVLNCNQWTSPTAIEGGQTIEGYQEGALIRAWKEGKILILDEMPKLDSNTAGILNDALAKSAKKDAIIFNGRNEPIKKHDDFGCIATGNTTGKGYSAQYVGNNKQDASLIDRFSGSIYEIGFNTELERALIYPPLVRVCWAIRKQIALVEGKDGSDANTEDLMTLRTMLNFQRNYELEMQREMRLATRDGDIPEKIQHGKTLIDALTSYFLVMNQDKAKAIQEKADIESFYNNYKGKEMKEEFRIEYQKRVA